MLEVLDIPSRKARLLVEIAKYPASTYADLEIYDQWAASDFKVLPRAGGLLDQPAGLMYRLRLIKIKKSLAALYYDLEKREAAETAAFIAQAKAEKAAWLARNKKIADQDQDQAEDLDLNFVNFDDED